ncbi:RND family transporter [Euzebya sp.]|uniref:efflux RND transporter permease subunit n=1 Tax=Euzebya sp. TaxID=1971409 RepID=UPI003512A188
MDRLVIMLSRAVRRAPAIVLIGAIALTAVIGAFAGQIEQGGGNEGFSPDNPELQAQQRIADEFGSSGDVVLQVLLRGDDGADVLSSAGLAATLRLQQALAGSDVADLLVQRSEQPAVVSPLNVVLQGVAQQGGDPETLDDAAVDQAFTGAIESLPPEQSGFVTGLLPDDVDPATAESDVALAVVFLDPAALPEDDFEAAAEVQRVAEVVEGLDVDGVSLEPFATELLFASTDDFAEEIGRLFASAIGIIILILAFVYFVKPRDDSSWAASLRRTAADVALTLLVVIMAIGWVQGAAGLLGPNVLGVIGPLAETGQIVPVLLIGLGVDYGIHLTARYREETGEGTVSEAIGTATSTVGIALILATITTVVGFLTNVTSPIPALKDFGILAAVGITAAFVLMLTVFPAVRLLLDRRAEAKGRLPRHTLTGTGEGALPKAMGRLSVLAERAAIPTLVVFVVIGGALGGIGLANVSTEFSFTDFLPEDDPLVTTLDTITEEFGAGFGETTNVLVEGEVDAEAHNAMVAATQELTGVDDVVTFGENAAASSPVSVLGQVLASLVPADGVPADGAPADGAPAQIDPAVAQQVAAMVEPGSLTVPEGTDVPALYDLLVQAAPAAASQVIAEDGRPVLFTIQTEAGEDRADELATALAEVFAPVEEALGEGSVTATSNNIITTEIVSSLRDSQLQSLFIAIAAAMALLVATYWITQRRPMLGVITIAPVALIVLWTFGMMAATGVPVGPVTATIAALAVGIGVPYTIHVTNRWTEDRRNADPATAIRATVRHTGGALAGSAFTTIAGFGILITSSLTPFQQFGLVTVYSIAFALIASTIVLPAMLFLYDRHRRARGDDPAAARATAGAERGPDWSPPDPADAVTTPDAR